MNNDSTTTMIIYRHVESVAGSKGRCEGSFDTELSENGRAQLRDLFVPHSDYLPVTAVFSSPLRRSMATAEFLGGQLGVPVVSVPQLRDRNLGEFQGHTWLDLSNRHGDLMSRCFEEQDVAPLGGETRRQLETRVLSVVRTIASVPAEGRVVLVTHTEAIRSIVDRYGTQRWRGLTSEVVNGSFTIAQVPIAAARSPRAC